MAHPIIEHHTNTTCWLLSTVLLLPNFSSIFQLSKSAPVDLLAPKHQILTTIWLHSDHIMTTFWQRPARFSFLENSREFFFIFTSHSRSRAVSNSLSLLEKEWRDFIFNFSLLEKSESYPYFTLFSREKKVKSCDITSPLSLFPIVFPRIVISQVSISLKKSGQISV